MSISLPLLSNDFWELVDQLLPVTGTGVVVIDWVVVVVSDETPCAIAAPVERTKLNTPTTKYFVISRVPCSGEK